MGERWLLRAARVVPCDPEQPESLEADVLVEDGVIRAIGRDLRADDCEGLDLEGKILMPGFIDAHRHVWQTPLRGLGVDWTVMDYLAAVRVKLAPVFTSDDVFAGNFAGAIEALDAGVTTLVDYSHVVSTPEHADAAIDGLERAGIRALYAYGFAPPSDTPGAFAAHADRLEHARSLRRGRFAANDGLVRMGAALTEMQCPWEQSRAEIAAARALDLPITLHASAWPVTVRSEAARMSDEGLLGPDMLFVHCTFSSDEDLRRIADAGASIVATPESELQMGMGFPVTGKALAHGARLALGCDVVTSNGGDMFTAMRLALQVERGQANARAGMPTSLALRAGRMLSMVTSDAAASVGLGRTVGMIRTGLDADLVVLAKDAPNLTPIQRARDAIVMHAHAGNVDSVMVRGRFIKRDGRLLGADAREAKARVERARNGILERAGGAGAVLADRASISDRWDVGRVGTGPRTASP